MKLNEPSAPLAMSVALTTKLGSSAKVLHALLVSWDTDHDNIVELDQQEIADRLSISKRAVRALVEELSSVRLVDVAKEGKYNRYLLLPIPADLVDSSVASRFVGRGWPAGRPRSTVGALGGETRGQ